VKKAKIILLILAGIAVLAVAAVFFLVQNLDAMVKSAIEKYGSEAAGTTVRVQTVRIELKSGRGSIHGLTVANPTGFSSERIFSLGEIALDLDPASLTTNLPVVKEIRIDAPTFLYEVNAQAQTNLGAVKQNLKRFSAGRSQPSRPAAEKSGERRLRVKRLTIAGGRGTLDLTAVGGQTLTAKMPPVTLTDLGGRQGLPPAALGEAILAALVKNLEQTAARQGVEQALRGKLGEEAGRLQQELDEKLAPGAGDALKKMLGR
jgi:hypothetical protein